jgi:hypothetical protein
MEATDEARAAQTRAAMRDIIGPEGSIRDLALRSGLSEPTIRSIAATGIISSMHTAAALEAATSGAITVAAHMQPGARGETVYGEFPGDALLRVAIASKRTPSEVLASVGITQQDLNGFMSGNPISTRVRQRVIAAFSLLGIEIKGAVL